MIPVLGIPILNRGDLLLRLVEGIDFPVAKLVLVCNRLDGLEDSSVTRAVTELENGVKLGERQIKEIFVERSSSNRGVAASWNLIVQQHPAIYHMLVGNDVQFAPGDLQKMHEFTLKHLDHALILGNHWHSFFCVTEVNTRLAGTFDENIWPAYLEDCDHKWRLRVLERQTPGRRLMITAPDICSVHGEVVSMALDGAPIYRGSSTVRSDEKLRAANAITHRNNWTYYHAKWGGYNNHEKFLFPFNDPAWPVNQWRFIPEMRKAQEQVQPLIWNDRFICGRE